MGDKQTEEMEKMKEDLEGKITKMRSEYDEKVEDLEKRLEVALGMTKDFLHFYSTRRMK